jgi:hypothetical protein
MRHFIKKIEKLNLFHNSIVFANGYAPITFDFMDLADYINKDKLAMVNRMADGKPSSKIVINALIARCASALEDFRVPEVHFPLAAYIQNEDAPVNWAASIIHFVQSANLNIHMTYLPPGTPPVLPPSIRSYLNLENPLEHRLLEELYALELLYLSELHSLPLDDPHDTHEANAAYHRRLRRMISLDLIPTLNILLETPSITWY